MKGPIGPLGKMAITLTLLGIGYLAFVHPTYIAPQFKLMFSDFGGELPPLTRYALKKWFGPVAAVPALLLIGLALFEPVESKRRGSFLVGAFLCSAAGVGLVLAALYFPVFDLAGNIRPD